MDIGGPLDPKYLDYHCIRKLRSSARRTIAATLPLLMARLRLATLPSAGSAKSRGDGRSKARPLTMAVVQNCRGLIRDMPERVLVLKSSDQENAGTRISDEYSPLWHTMPFPVTFGGLVDPMVRGAVKYGKTRR
jgi:hypothetical protein